MIDQLTVTEAAAVLGIRQVTARVRLHRARKALRAHADPGDAADADSRGPALSRQGGSVRPGERVAAAQEQ